VQIYERQQTRDPAAVRWACRIYGMPFKEDSSADDSTVVYLRITHAANKKQILDASDTDFFLFSGRDIQNVVLLIIVPGKN
jgi:hypothetical protein